MDNRMKVGITVTLIIISSAINITVLMSYYITNYVSDLGSTSFLIAILSTTFDVILIILAYRINNRSKLAWYLIVAFLILSLITLVFNLKSSIECIMPIVTEAILMVLLFQRAIMEHCNVVKRAEQTAS